MAHWWDTGITPDPDGTVDVQALNVGSAAQLIIDANGDITRIRNIDYHWPTLQGAAGTFLQNDGAGNLSWASGAILNITGTPVAGRVTYWSGASSLTSDADLTFNGTTLFTGALDVSAKLVVDVNGNLTKVNNVTYSWPASQGAATTFLQNDGAGALSWVTLPAALINPTPAANRLAYWLNATTLTSNSGGTFDGTTLAVPAFDVATSKLVVDSNGNLTKVRNVAYSWPSSQGAASTVLQNNGSGTLSWVASPTISGTPVANQVAIWNSATAIKGLGNLTHDGTILAVGTSSGASNVLSLGDGQSAAVSSSTETRLRHNNASSKFQASTAASAWTDVFLNLGGQTITGILNSAVGAVLTLDHNSINNREASAIETLRLQNSQGSTYSTSISLFDGIQTGSAFFILYNGRSHPTRPETLVLSNSGTGLGVGLKQIIMAAHSIHDGTERAGLRMKETGETLLGWTAGTPQTSYALTLGGTTNDNALTSIYIDSAGTTNANKGHLAMANGGSAAVSGANTGRLRYNSSGQQFEVSLNGGAYTAISTAAGGTVTGSAATSQVAFWNGTSSIVGSSLFAYDIVNSLVLTKASVGTGTDPGSTIKNTTAAAAGAQQYSPVSRLLGNGWATGSGASKTVDFGLQVRPVQGSTLPTGELHLLSAIDGGSYASRWKLADAGQMTTTIDSVGILQSITGYQIKNTTVASAGNQQYSPLLQLTGQGWKTNATAASQTVDFALQTVPVQGTANPTSELRLWHQENGSGWLTQWKVASGGQVTTQIDSFGTSTTVGYQFLNNAAAANGAQQNSPAIQLTGQGWATDSGGSSRAVDVLLRTLPVQGAANPTGKLSVGTQINGGGYTEQWTVDSAGLMTAIDAKFTGTTIGFYNATPVAQHSATGESTVTAAGAGTALKADTTMTGGTGATSYTLGDVINTLKNLGLMAL